MAHRKNRRGIALAWGAIVLFVMIGMVGLSIDWGKVTWNAHQLQNAADAAALAGAMALPEGLTAVIDSARDIAWLNEADRLRVALRPTEQPEPFSGTDESPYDVLTGLYYPQFHGTPLAWRPTTVHANAAKAIARRGENSAEGAPPLGLLFGPMFGTDTVTTRRSAIALLMVRNGAGLILLAKDGIDLDIGGNINLIVKNGDIQVDSEREPCVELGRNTTLETLALYAHGTVLAATSYDFPIVQHAPRMGDPLADVPDLAALGLPPYGQALKWDPVQNAWVDAGIDVSKVMIDRNVIDSKGALDPNDPRATAMLRLTPGYYPKGFNLGTDPGKMPKLELQRGVYAIGGNQGQSSGVVANGGIFHAEGVMLYLTDDGKGNWAEISLNGATAEIHISEYVYQAGDDTRYEVYSEAGLAIFQNRQREPYKGDLDNAQPFLAGGSSSTFAGTIYLHNNSYTTVPRVSGGAGNIGIQVITDRLRVAGNSDVIIDYDGRNKYKRRRCVLVE